MSEKVKSLLYESLERDYTGARKTFEDKQQRLRIQQLAQDIVNKIGDSPERTRDTIQIKRGTYVEDDTINLTPATFEFGNLMEEDETAIIKSSDWQSVGQREVCGAEVDLQVNFKSIEFARLQDKPPHSRPGPIIIEGKFKDKDGIKAEFPLARFFPDKVSGEYKLLYIFGSEIPFGSEDFQEIERIVREVNKHL